MNELETAEADVAALESQANAELQKLQAAGREVEGRLRRVREMVAQAQGVGALAPDLTARLQATVVPSVPVEQVQAASWAARLKAVEARREAVKQLRVQMQEVQQQVRVIARQLMSDEQAAERHLGTAKAVAQKVAAAAKQLEVPAAPAAVAIGKVLPRREAPRVRMQVKVDFGSQNNFYSGFSTNLSDGGVFIATVKVVPIGTPMDLYFRLPSGDGVEATGVVRWVREVDDRQPDVLPGLGVQFLNLTDEARAAINLFVKSREPMFYPD